MHRILKLNTPLLALVFSIPAEVAFCLVAFVAARIGRPDEPTLFSRCWGWFHDPADALSLQSLRFIRPQSIEPSRTIIFVLLALLQWYLILLIAIFLYRR